MTAFKRLGPDDQLDNVLILHPSYALVSGSQGWRGSPEGSASLSLYGGARRRGGVVSSMEYQSLAPNVSQTGNPRRGLPMTASVSLAYVTNEPLALGQVTDTRWGEEHWDVINRLYDDYSAINADYVTASYDYYSLYFNPLSRNIVIASNQSGAGPSTTGSFTIESWIKPFQATGSDMTIQSLNSSFLFGIQGSSGRLSLGAPGLSATSSFGPVPNRWSHVAFSYDSQSGSGTFYVNQVFAGSTQGPTGSIAMATTAYWSIGNVVTNDFAGFNSLTGGTIAFNGLIGESRVWDTARTPAQISGSAFGRLTGSAAAGPTMYLMLNEGPLMGRLGLPTQAMVAGSGAIDYASLTRGRSGEHCVARLVGFSDRVGPSWHPNDNVSFFPTKARPVATAQTSGLFVWGPVQPNPLRQMLVLDVPSAFYGRQLVPGSVRMTCRAFESFGFVRTIVDDGRGGLYISGSVCSSSLEAREEYAGVGWNKVGNVFYGEGLIVIKDPSLLDFGRTDGAALVATDTFALSFKGDSRVPVKTLMCRVDHGEFNCSSNQTFYSTDGSGARYRRHPSGSIRVSTVGIYNSDRELVAIARLADPVRIRSRDRINIRIRMDF